MARIELANKMEAEVSGDPGIDVIRLYRGPGLPRMGYAALFHFGAPSEFEDQAAAMAAVRLFAAAPTAVKAAEAMTCGRASEPGRLLAQFHAELQPPAPAPTPQADAMAAKLAEITSGCRQLVDLIVTTGALGRRHAEGLDAQLREMEGRKHVSE